MSHVFNLDEMLSSLNESVQGKPVTDLPDFENMSFIDDENGHEFELGSGISRGEKVIKVRYRKNLIPLNLNANGYYISVYNGTGIDGRPSFRIITGSIKPISPNFVRWKPIRGGSTKKNEAKKVATKPRGSSRSIRKKPSKRTKELVDVTMMSEEDLKNIDSPATRRELARRLKLMRVEVSDLTEQLKRGGLFGRRRIKRSALAQVNADLRYLNSL